MIQYIISQITKRKKVKSDSQNFCNRFKKYAKILWNIIYQMTVHLITYYIIGQRSVRTGKKENIESDFIANNEILDDLLNKFANNDILDDLIISHARDIEPLKQSIVV
jgi:hypothetical protein